MSDDTPSPRHSPIEDAQGLAYGSFMAAVGVLLLTHLGFVTGQTAGLAILISYATGWGFAPVFFVVNLPFYWLGYRRLGLGFMLKSFIAVATMSALVAILPAGLQFGHVHPAVGALLVGFLTGSALLALFRHGASLGGVGIVALYLQDATGFRAGWTQLIFDACLFACALMLRDWQLVAWSFLGALVLNLVIAINHRRDRYVV
ncbi:putative 5xTM membrane YitT family protein [Paracoccus pantotrophus]|uniref:YitT family protein n=1 Tax=Paracoccus pantotrophus TaxID=82367 RepID=A0AAE6TSR9_PARPN|nr:YitT family protein [Paracoccus pantotrophus]QFG35487.1 YitT family protein [Paracoccus pantotrophus]RKS44286.1 putative 5xTM membrane YitT family protein [Paracoccus pantotrophus]